MQAIKLIDPQLRLAAKVRNQKRDVQLLTIPESILEKIRSIATEPIRAVMENPLYGKVSFQAYKLHSTALFWLSGNGNDCPTFELVGILMGLWLCIPCIDRGSALKWNATKFVHIY